MNGHIMKAYGMVKLWINIRDEWTNYGLTYAMNGQIMD